MSARELPIVGIRGRAYFQDDRLGEYRAVDNPHERLALDAVVAPRDYFAMLRADRYTAKDWRLFYLRLRMGDPVIVHYTLWCQLLETRTIRSVSRAGIIICTGDMLVRLSSAGQPRTWLQALATPPGIALEPGHEHSIIPVERSDGWEVIRCIRCGAEW